VHDIRFDPEFCASVKFIIQRDQRFAPHLRVASEVNQVASMCDDGLNAYFLSRCVERLYVPVGERFGVPLALIAHEHSGGVEPQLGRSEQRMVNATCN
jgi:hypothetical protein